MRSCEKENGKDKQDMMIFTAALGSALLVLAAFWASLRLLEPKYDLQLKKSGKSGLLYTGLCVLLTAFFTFAVILYAGMDRSRYADPFSWVQTLGMIWGMSVLAVTDYKAHKIPNDFLKILLLLFAAIRGIAIIIDPQTGLSVLFRSLAGGLVGGLIFLLCYLLSRKQLGAGDVKLSAVLGLYATGEKIIGILAYGILLCCIYSVIQVIRKKITIKDGVPLVPFLYAGMLLVELIL